MSKKQTSPQKEMTQSDYARRALSLKQKAEEKSNHETPESRTAGDGQLHEHERREHKEPPMGALDAEGHRPVLERSRKVR